VRVRVRLSKIEVRCESACETIIEVRVCVRHTVKFLATQRLVATYFREHSHNSKISFEQFECATIEPAHYCSFEKLIKQFKNSQYTHLEIKQSSNQMI
jgi:hypothetical protein